eukprot:TRINITY_DN4367_c0_g1_i8.p2 TRINITY_DN4367_c0_g1~~TRINITY_DN4367_c0_g1_i8.p2  ORF type:complete len:174 (+),score=0.01 TRINITY_DN4367_c0_g1_i8:494-1015(+)
MTTYFLSYLTKLCFAAFALFVLLEIFKVILLAFETYIQIYFLLVYFYFIYFINIFMVAYILWQVAFLAFVCRRNPRIFIIIIFSWYFGCVIVLCNREGGSEWLVHFRSGIKLLVNVNVQWMDDTSFRIEKLNTINMYEYILMGTYIYIWRTYKKNLVLFGKEDIQICETMIDD